MGRIRIESKTKDNRDTELVDELVKVWESSVRTSHDFLSEQDIRNLAPQVKAALQGGESLVVVSEMCIRDSDELRLFRRNDSRQRQTADPCR